MDVLLSWTDCDEAGDYVVPNLLSPRDLVSRPDNMDETVLHTLNKLTYDKKQISSRRLHTCESKIIWKSCLAIFFFRSMYKYVF